MNGTTGNTGPGKAAQENGARTGASTKKTAKERAADQLKRAGVDPAKMTYAEMRSKLKQLKTEGKLGDGRAENGGHENSGRHTTQTVLNEKGLHIVLDKHANETVKVTVTDRRSGQTVEIEKPRVLVALEKLFERATKGAGETQALEKWLDRALGKAPQAVAMKHSGEVGTYTAKRPTKAALAAKRAYERSLYEGEADE